MAEDVNAKAHVAGPKGRKPTPEETKAMAAALFDSIVKQQTKQARSQEDS